MGSLPALPVRQRGRAVAFEDRQVQWRNLLIESIDATRALLLHTSATQAVRSVMITSATGGEGKTSLACHLAMSLARSGRPTLLIDCDLRRPFVHRIFDLLPSPGMSEVLRGELSLDEAIQRVDNGLCVLTAGRADAQAIQTLAHEETRGLFQSWKDRFAFVIVDTPPILPVADGLFVGQQVDAAICSVMRDVSRIPRVFEANERLLAMGVRILGAVMVGERWGHYRSRYDYKSGYGYPSSEAAGAVDEGRGA
jgi:capsular exopolysaccharide synthesis family protein